MSLIILKAAATLVAIALFCILVGVLFVTKGGRLWVALGWVIAPCMAGGLTLALIGGLLQIWGG